MNVKMFEWDQEQDSELTIQSVVGLSLEEAENDAREQKMGLARAEELAKLAKQGVAFLRELAMAMTSHKDGDAPQIFTLDALDETSRTMVTEVLGRGEVSGHITEPLALGIQESVFPGLWRVKNGADANAPEQLIIADVPPMLRASDIASQDADMVIREDAQDVMNAMPVLAEVRDRVQAYELGQDNHVINFTLLPMSEADMALLRDTLGVGHVDLMSKGYGACRVCSTRWAHVWSVQFFNSMDTIILDTLEVGDVPVSVRAAGADFEDSGERILEIIEAYL